MIDIEIDKNSGFCFGVVYAIEKAETNLNKNKKIFCIGDIVHNSEEIKRLEKKGLITINHNQLEELENETVLIRAHGEPPETYKTILKNNLKIIDASCPVVLKLQCKIKNGYEKIKSSDGQIVIFGKKGHAEVNGLVGQTNNNAIIISSLDEIERIDFNKDIIIFSQTTKNLDDFRNLVAAIEKRTKETGVRFEYHDTICRQVSNREKKIREFCRKKDLVLFVSGKKSSNGKVLFKVCEESNSNSYKISSIDEIDKKWFHNVETIGICGATSTPLWLMEEVKCFIEKQLNHK